MVRIMLGPCCMVLAVTTALLPTFATSATTKVRHRVRKLHLLKDAYERRRANFMDFTFSEEGGVHVEIPLLQLQFFDTPDDPNLDTDATDIMEKAIADFLEDHLKKTMVSPNDAYEVTSADVMIIESRSVQMEDRRRMRRLGDGGDERQEEQIHQRILQQIHQGTEVDVVPIITFRDDPGVPTVAVVEEFVLDSFRGSANQKEFVDDFLMPAMNSSINTHWANVTTIVLRVDLAATTAAPNTTSTATPAPGAGTFYSELNEQAQNPQTKENLKIFPAVAVGILVFILTIVLLAQRRQRIADFENSYEENDIEIDDETKQAREQDYRGTMETVNMDDGETTLHIPTVAEPGEEAQRIFDSPPLIVSRASDLNGSYDDEDYLRAGNYLPASYSSDYSDPRYRPSKQWN